MTLRVVETYFSYQGEGPNTGKPTVFVRFAGCNFKCPGWPCDTQHAIDPKIFTKTQRFWRPVELADHVLTFETDNICLTGGEVFLQNNADLKEFINAMKVSRETLTVEIFTNGALSWGTEIPLMVDTFIVDWKLPGSGEEYEPTNVLGTNLSNLNQLDAIKFTIADTEDFVEAKRRYEKHILSIPVADRPKVYAGVAWGKELTTERLCDYMRDNNLDWNLNVQVHKYIWHPDKIGV